MGVSDYRLWAITGRILWLEDRKRPHKETFVKSILEGIRKNIRGKSWLLATRGRSAPAHQKFSAALGGQT